MRSAVLFVLLLVLYSCKKDTPSREYQTENVIIVVIDGPRYSETWGDSTHRYIPRLAQEMAQEGVVYTQFFNNGPTYTLAGHTSISTGYKQEIDNTGAEFPENPSIFQYWNKKYPSSDNSSWIISSKDKLEVLSNTKDSVWTDKYTPSVSCGENGLSSGSRHDSITLKEAIRVLNDYHPRLVLVSFREPDLSGHNKNWDDYLKGIKSSDEYAYRIWKHIQSSPFYKDKTTLFITNDHGRHLDNVADGFASHGDNCDGCRHIFLYAFGPDIRKGAIVDTPRELIDLTATISELLNLSPEKDKGDVMLELFE